MAVSDITREIPRFESEDTFQFTLATSPRVSSIQFMVFNTDGNTLAPAAVQSGVSVSESGTNTGLFYVSRILPTTPAIYTYAFIGWDAASLTYTTRGYFEIYKTEILSFQTYADITDTVRTARQIFGRGELTFRDMRPYLESADAWIDTKLRPIATVPVSPTPNFLRDASKVGGLFMYYSDRYAFQKDDAPPGIVERWRQYNELIDAIVAGSASLVGVDVSDQPIDINMDGYKPIFDFRGVEDQRIDPDLIDANEDDDT